MVEEYLKGYKKMFLIRIAQEELVKLYLEKKIMSIVHFYIGQEAVAGGVSCNLLLEDKVIGNHRSHGYYLAKGGDLRKLVCELLGKENGVAKGKGGSMHMIDKSVNFIGSTPILGSAAPLACGTAFSKKYNKEKGIAVAYIGDGASEEGVVYETLNLAALHKLPLLLVIENNGLSITSKINDRRSDRYDVAKIVSGFGLKFARSNGNDFVDVYEKSKTLIQDIKNGDGPAVLECKVYRHMAHSTPLFDETYRDEDILENRTKSDSVKRLRLCLLDNKVSENSLVEIEKKIKEEVLGAIQFAQDSNYPSQDQLYTDVYA